MPLDIIRNDITRVSADAIVNTANPRVAVGAGTDTAIYEAAGREQLLAERAKIGNMRPGQAAYTPAFALDAKYIIHTVGPAWRGGNHHERETVAMCYRNSLGIADELGCETVAFPLISSGSYGFPKDEALKIAISEISSFLFSHDMTIYLVVYDRDSFVISGKAFANVKSYIEESEVRAYPYRRRFRSEYRTDNSSRSEEKELFGSLEPMAAPESSDLVQRGEPPVLQKKAESRLESREPRWKRFLSRRDTGALEQKELEEAVSASPDMIPAEDACDERTQRVGEQEDVLLDADIRSDDSSMSFGGSAQLTLDDIFDMKSETFQQVLFKIIDRKGLTDPEVYKKANIDRKLFSKIRSDVDYMPSKRTALALIIGLELNLDEATDLLQRAGFSFSPGNISDLTVRYCIEQHMYDIHTINCYLFEFGQKTLG